MAEDLGERVAVLEAHHESTTELLASIGQKVDALHSDMVRYKGFLGGVTFIFSCVGVFLSFGKGWLMAHWK